MKYSKLLCLVLAFLLLLSGCVSTLPENKLPDNTSSVNSEINSDIPEFLDQPFVVVNGNNPGFKTEELVIDSFESYSELDSLGRCGVATACIGVDIMPTEDRGEIGQVKPTGWHTVKYDIVDGKYLYNRCHLIGFQLTGENANKKNLITGTRYFNVDGMLPFENMVADYVKETKNHVMYRVTPVYDVDNLVANGVYMEAYSVEDGGEGICFNVFVYNNQPGIVIDYQTGESRLESEPPNQQSKPTSSETDNQYVLNTNSKKFHFSSCSGVKNIKSENYKEYTGTRENLVSDGYSPCGICKP